MIKKLEIRLLVIEQQETKSSTSIAGTVSRPLLINRTAQKLPHHQAIRRDSVCQSKLFLEQKPGLVSRRSVHFAPMVADKTSANPRDSLNHDHGLRQLESCARRECTVRQQHTLRTLRPTDIPANAGRATRAAADATGTTHAASAASATETQETIERD